MWPNPQFRADLVTFTEKKPLMENFIFCAVELIHNYFSKILFTTAEKLFWRLALGDCFISYGSLSP